MLLQSLRVPSFLGGMARGLLGKSNEIQFKHCRKDALKEADVVVLIGKLFRNKNLKKNVNSNYFFQGTVCDFRLGYGKVLSRKSKIITVNRNKSQLTKVNQ